MAFWKNVKGVFGFGDPDEPDIEPQADSTPADEETPVKPRYDATLPVYAVEKPAAPTEPDPAEDKEEFIRPKTSADPDPKPIDDPEPEAEPEPESNSDPEPEPDAKLEPEPKPEPEPEPEPEVDVLGERLDAIKLRLEQLTVANKLAEALQQEVTRLSNDLQEARAQKAIAETTTANLRNYLDGSREENAVLRRKLFDLSQQAARDTAALNDSAALNERLNVLSEQKSDLEAKTEALIRENASLRLTIENLSSRPQPGNPEPDEPKKQKKKRGRKRKKQPLQDLAIPALPTPPEIADISQFLPPPPIPDEAETPVEDPNQLSLF